MTGELTSLDVGEYLLDEFDQEKNYTFYISEQDILEKVTKLWRVPFGLEEIDQYETYVQILHTRGCFYF